MIFLGNHLWLNYCNSKLNVYKKNSLRNRSHAFSLLDKVVEHYIKSNSIKLVIFVIPVELLKTDQLRPMMITFEDRRGPTGQCWRSQQAWAAARVAAHIYFI